MKLSGSNNKKFKCLFRYNSKFLAAKILNTYFTKTIGIANVARIRFRIMPKSKINLCIFKYLHF